MAEPPLRIAYVVTSTAVGGAERQVFELASTFRDRGWGVGIVSMLPLHEQFLPLRDDGIRLASLNMSQGVPDPRALVRLARTIRSWQPDIVHGHMVHANLITRLTRLLVPTPRIISTMHNQDEGEQWRYFAYRLTDRLADVTTTVSKVAVDEAIRRHAVPSDRIRLIPNGIRTDRYPCDHALRDRTRAALGLKDEFIWLTVGRLTDAKRHIDLLEAFRRLHQGSPPARLLIAGTGPLRPILEARIARYSLSDAVSLLGLRGDIPALMQAADAFVMSSAWEGLPMVLLEAAASSLPIVATNVGGSSEAVLSGETGFLVPARHPVALSEAMVRLMRLERDERRAMGRRAQAHAVERFDQQRIADQWETLYRS